MNFAFSDITSSVLNMAQQDNAKETIFKTSDTGSNKQFFEQKLNKAFEKIEQQGKEIPLTIEPGQKKIIQQDSVSATKGSGKAIDFLSQQLSQKKGKSFISALQEIFLMLAKGDLKNISIDADGLEALKKILLKAGFKESDLDELIAGLSDKLENETLTLDELFDNLFALEFETNSPIEPLQENFLETSALPFIESVLNSLGLPLEKIQEILNEADKGEKGISLDVVINKLQNVQKSSFYTQQHYETSQGDENYKMLFKQLGLELIGFEQSESKKSPLTLGELVSSLEKLRVKISAEQSSNQFSNQGLINNEQKSGASEKPLDLFEALFKGLEFKNKGLETQDSKSVYGHIKEQLQNGLTMSDKNALPEPGKNELSMQGKKELLPDIENFNKKDLSLVSETSKNEADLNLSQKFKPLESLLGIKEGEILNKKDQVTGTKEFIKQIKSETAKLVDQGQMSALDSKTNETQQSLNILKTKPAFKNLPNYVTQQVSKGLVRAINKGENTLRIQLKPAQLGRLVMTIDNTGNNIKVNIMTENHVAKEILTSNVNELKTVLSNSGVNLERFDVDMNSDFRQSMADARSQAQNFGKRNKNKEKVLFDPVNGEGVNDAINHPDALSQGGSLHFVA